MDQLVAMAMAQPSSPTSLHVAHKIPAGDGPYARAKHFQVKASISFHSCMGNAYIWRNLSWFPRLLLIRFLFW
jgi:hypothetical protein